MSLLFFPYYNGLMIENLTEETYGPHEHSFLMVRSIENVSSFLWNSFQEYSIHFPSTGLEIILKEMSCGRLNASWKISSSAVDGQSFLVIDGSLLN